MGQMVADYSIQHNTAEAQPTYRQARVRTMLAGFRSLLALGLTCPALLEWFL